MIGFLNSTLREALREECNKIPKAFISNDCFVALV
jgi:hypothetical protein